MNRIKIQARFIDDHVSVVGAPTTEIKNAIKDMAVEYNDLTFIGHKDGHHFVIERVINNDIRKDCTNSEVLGMYYYAFGPECISISNFED